MTMPNPDYSALVAKHREYFLSGATRPIAWRKAQLEALKAMFTENHDELCHALWKDLRRNLVDADLMDVEYNVKEADYALKHLDAWMSPERVHTPLVLQPGHVRVRRDPLGVTLIISAWNEPFMLLYAPLVAAFAGGNTAVLKPSELAVACSAAAAKLTPKYFDPRAVAVVEGAVPETTALLEEKWDFIFFTGGPQVGKIVHQAAARNLIGRGRHPMGQRSARSARTLCVRGGYKRSRAHSGGHPIGRRRRQRLHAPAAHSRASVWRRREFRHGQISWSVGFRGVHQCARRSLSQRQNRPRRALPSLFKACD
jgi:hypothetical protein